MLNVGIVGCGWVAEKHISFINANPNSNIVGIVDSSNAILEKTASKYNIGSSNIFNTLNDLLAKKKVDVIHILTPPFSHKKLALDAIREGKHVYIEKPLALNHLEVEEILKMAKDKRVLVCPGYNYLFDPIVSKALKIIQSDSFGRVVYVESYYGMNMRRYDRLKTSKDNDIHWSYTLPGGFHQNYITHPLYMCLKFIGKIKNISIDCRSMGAIPQHLTDEIRVLINGENATGLVVQSYSCEPYQHYITIYGEKQAIKIDWRNISLIQYRKHRLPDALNRVMINNLDLGWQYTKQSVSNFFGFATKRAVPYHGMKLLIDKFYHSIQNASPPPISKDLILSTEIASDRIYEAIPKKHLDFEPRTSSQQNPQYKGKVLVTGASGFVGKEVVKHFMAKGYYVRAFVRKLSYIDELEQLGVEIVFGDIRHYPSFRKAAEGMEHIIHLAAALGVPADDYMEITLGGVHNLIRIVDELKPIKVVYMSSMSVYDVIDCKPGTVLDENQIYERRPQERGAYTASKLEAEKAIKDILSNSNTSWTILRPSMIINSRSAGFIKSIGLSFGQRLRLIFGMGFDKLRLIPVEDVVNVITLCIESPISRSKIYNINHPDRINKREYLKIISNNNPNKSWNIYIPHFFMRGIIYIQEKVFTILNKKPILTIYRYNTAQKNNYFSTDKISNELKWCPCKPLKEYLSINS